MGVYPPNEEKLYEGCWGMLWNKFAEIPLVVRCSSCRGRFPNLSILMRVS